MSYRSGERVDQLTEATWRYLRGGSYRAAAAQPRGTFAPTIDPFVSDEKTYFRSALGSWVDDAACAEADPRIFDFDPRETDESDVIAAHAAVKQYCVTCPVTAACAAEGRDLAGVWGGKIHLRQGRARPDGRQPRRTGEQAAIRQWAAQNGYEVGERGRLPLAIRAAYDARSTA